MTEQVNDYAEPVIKIQKSIKHLEGLLRLKRLEEAMDEIPNIETQCIRLRNHIYKETEHG